MAGRISIPIEFEVARESAASVIKTLENQLAKLKPGTAIYDGIKKQIADATKLLGKVDKQFSFGYSTEGEISRTEKDFISLAAVIDTVNAAFERLDVSALNLNITEGEFGGIATQVKAVNAQLQTALVNLQKLQGTKVKDLFDGRETKRLGQFTAEQKESSGLAVYEKIGQQMEAIGLQAADAETRVQSLERALAALQQTQTRKGYTSASTDAEHASAARIYGLTGTSDEKMGDIRARIMEELQGAFKSDGTKKSTTDAVVTEILTAFEIDESEITAALTAKVSERQERLRQIVYNLDESAGKGITSDKVKHARSRTHGMAREYAGAATLQQQIQDTTNELVGAQTEKGSFENQLAGLTVAFQSLRTKLQAKKIIGADGTTESSETQAEIDQLRTQVEALSAQLTSQVKNESGKNITPPSGDSGRGNLNSLNEADAFKASMQNTVKQWFSVQQIINTVKNGIRQAYQDIQGLDKAMTNIAVVTDMSVSDLWGKINEYMSIAQQYGVTTQGVYEVSQLYYQQGLSTNEVMAATTETLKLARIAGMGYAEAADAMTVAIRSFKMGMSDAATVTDVYSKVAAITASDSEELAIAMSKTASSAESVGSSFENTTAMLAVMIETTRESAQNLGSALKSIISRYGEMKVGLTVDSEGEDIDYNKVDTALKSVGISIKDAQGQFRNFDEVIFELSEKWDSLDKNTQRYIATIMAGNRQQSRFIALVDNWERLDEVSNAAHNAEDAGLLQYAKTLDSLETKINNIKTSFQQFYMNIINGPAIGTALDFINKLIQGLTKLGNWQSLLNIAGLIRNIKLIGTLIVNGMAPLASSIVTQFKNGTRDIVQIAKYAGGEAGRKMAEEQKKNYNAHLQPAVTSPAGNGKEGRKGSSTGLDTWKNKTAGKVVSVGGALLGTALTSIGTGLAADNARAGSIVSGIGNIASGASMGAALGPWGAAIGGLIGGLASLPAVLEAFDPAKVLEEKLQKAEEALEKANVEKASKAEEAHNLEDTIANLKRLQQARYESEEAEKAYIEASNAAFEQFPLLASGLEGFSEAGDVMIDVLSENEGAEYLLIQARQQAAKAATEAAAAEMQAAKAEREKLDYKYETLEENLENNNQGKEALLKSFFPQASDLNAINENKTLLEQILYGVLKQMGVSEIDTEVGFKSAIKNFFGIEDLQLKEYTNLDIEGTLKALETIFRNIPKGVSSSFGTVQNGIYNPSTILLDEYVGNIEELATDLSDIYFSGDIVTKLGLEEKLRNTNRYTEGQIEKIAGIQGDTSTYDFKAIKTALYEQAFKDFLLDSLGQAMYGFTDGLMETPSITDYRAVIAEYKTEKKASDLRLKAAEKAAVSSEVDELFIQSDSKEIAPWREVKYIDEIVKSKIYKDLSDQGFNADESFNSDGTLKETASADLRTLYDNLYTDLEGTFMNNLGANVEEFNTLYEKARQGKISSGQLKAGFEDLFKDHQWWEQENDLIYQYYKGIEERFEKSRERVSTFLSATTSKGNWGNNKKSITTWLNDIPPMYYNAIESFAKKINTQWDEKNITDEDANIIVKNYKEIWGTVKKAAGEDLQKLETGFSLLGKADLTTFEGIEEFKQGYQEIFGKEFNEELINGLENYLYIFNNLNTYIQNMISKTQQIASSFKDYASKQSKGFTLEEATKLIQEVQKIDPQKTWEDIFTYNKDGLLVLDDFNGTINDLYQGQLEEITKLQESLTEPKLTDAGLQSIIDKYNELATDEEGFTAENRGELLGFIKQQAGVEDKFIANTIINDLVNEALTAGTTVEDYLKTYSEQLNLSVEWLQRQLKSSYLSNSFDAYFKDKQSYKEATTFAGASTYEDLKQVIISSAGDKVNEEGFDSDKWVASFFEETDIDAYDANLLEGIELDELGNLIIKKPIEYANSLIKALNITDKAAIAAIHEAVSDAYNTQWETRTQQIETLLADYKFSTKEMSDMFSYLVGINKIDLSGDKYKDLSFAEQMAVWAKENNFGLKDNEWYALSQEAYNTAVSTIVAQNPDADFSDIPTWKEWLAQQVTDAAAQREKALKFLKEISIDMGPEKLNEAIELGLINANDISAEDYSALDEGSTTVWDVMNKYYRPSEGTDYAEAWTIGQERYRQDAAKKLNELFGKAAFKPEELLEIWEYIGEGQDFDAWAEQVGFEYDAITQQYYARGEKAFATLTSYGKTRYGQDINIPSSAALYGVEQRAMAKELEDKKIAFFKELSPEAGIEELDKAYEQGIITQEQYLKILADAVATEPIGGLVEQPVKGRLDAKRLNFEAVGYETPTSIYDSLKTIAEGDPELYQALLEGQASYEKQALTAIEEMFRDSTVSADMVSQMWSNVTDQTVDMITWAKNQGITYENGEWLIKNAEDAAKAYELMSSWWEREHKGSEFEGQKPSKEAFVSMVTSAQKVEEDAINEFIKTIAPDVTDADLQKAVEVGLLTWKDIASGQKDGKTIYEILIAAATEKGEEGQAALREAQKTYQQDATEAINSLFTDGFLSSEEIEKIWMNADTGEDMATWAAEAGFQLIGNEWQVTTEQAYNEMLQWVKDNYGEAYALMVPSYETLTALNPLKEAKSKKASLDFLKELTPDMDESKVLSGVEQGVFTEDQVRWAQDLVKTGFSWYEAMYATVGRQLQLANNNLNALDKMDDSSEIKEDELLNFVRIGQITYDQYVETIHRVQEQHISVKEALKQVLSENVESYQKQIAAMEASSLTHQAENITAVRSMIEKGTWSDTDITKIWEAKGGGSVEDFKKWAKDNFEWIDDAWYFNGDAVTYEALKDWIGKEYGTAVAEMLPDEKVLKQQSLFKKKSVKKEQIDFLSGLNYEASYAELEKALELGIITSTELQTWLDTAENERSSVLSFIGKHIDKTDGEALKAFNKAIVDENISRGESAQKLFDDNVLSWKEIAELWAADGATGDIGAWAQGKGLSYIDDEWHITTREGYDAIVEAAKKLYSDAWEAVTPTYEAIMGSQQLELDIEKDRQTNFFKELASKDEVTAEDAQRALELGIIDKEQLYAFQQGGMSYNQLLQAAKKGNNEWEEAWQKNYDETRLKELEELFGGNNGIFSREQVERMWKVIDGETDVNKWIDAQKLDFDGTSYKADAAKTYDLMQSMATKWWGDAAVSMIPSDTALTSLFNIEKEIQLDEQLDFMKGLTPEMKMAEAQKAVELGIISKDQLVWAEKTFEGDMEKYFHFIASSFNNGEGEAWDAFQESYEDYQATRMTEAQTFLGKTSFSLADMTNIWQATRDEGEEFGDWIEDLVFEGDLIFDGENWNVENPERIWPVIKEYIQEVYGFTDEDFDFEYMEQQFLASVHQQIANTKEKKLSFLRGLGETLTLDDLNEALETGILTKGEYDAVVSDGQITSDEIRGAIADSLEDKEEIAAYNEAIEQRNLQRIETITALFEDSTLSRDEIFDMYKAAGAKGDVILWAQQQGFVLEDGKWKAKTKQAYEAMKKYIENQFGTAYLYLLPSPEEWLASGLFDGLIEKESQISFIKEISPTATASTLKEAAEKLKIEFTQEEQLLLEAGLVDYYDILLKKLKASGNKEWQNWANLIELQNIDAVRRNVFKQTEFTTLEDYAAAYQQLADLGFTNHEIEYVLADQAISMEETANMIRALEARATGETETYLQGEALLAAAKKYNISLADFFERSVFSPTQVLDYLGLTLSNLSVEDYDAYISAQNDFNSSIQKLFEGTGTAEDMKRLIETTNQAAIKGYELTTDNFIITAEGIQLDRSQFFTALEILRQTDTNAYRAIRESFIADPSLWGEEINSITDVEERLNDLARQRAELGEKITDENAKQVALLNEQAGLYAEIYGTMSMQKTEGWDFLNNELHGNAENFISWSNSVHSAFEQVGSKEGIDPKNFINLLNYMQQMGVQVQTLGTNFNSWADLMQSAYKTFGKAMVTGSKVATTDIGVSAENMSTGMLDAVHAMAESQIKFLDAQIAMLEGLVALENVEFSGIGDFAIQMQGQLDKYNKAMNLTGDAAIKLEDLKISINGETYSLTQEGLADAEKAWQSLGYQGNFLDHLISQILSPEGQSSIMSGGVVEMNPTADIKLSTDTQATISEIQTANSILREIAANTDPGLQQRIETHQASGGADLSTEEGAVQYFNNNPKVFEGILGKDDEGISIVDKEAYEALSTIDKEIFNLWYASQNDTRFDQTGLYKYWYPDSDPDKKVEGGGRVTGEGNKVNDIQPTYTFNGIPDNGAYSYQWNEEAGKYEWAYAHSSPNGEKEMKFLPGSSKEAWQALGKQLKGYFDSSLEGNELPEIFKEGTTFNSKDWEEWVNTEKEKAKTVIDIINQDPYLQALYFRAADEGEGNLPGYSFGTTTGSYKDGNDSKSPFDYYSSIGNISNRVTDIYDNTAKIAALIKDYDLRTEEGQRGYYNEYLTPEWIKDVPTELPEKWEDFLSSESKPSNYDEMSDQEKLMAYQNAWLKEKHEWSDSDIDLWHKYSSRSATQDINKDGKVDKINWTEVNKDEQLSEAVKDAIQSYRETTDYNDNQLETWIENATENGEMKWEKVFASEGFDDWWMQVMKLPTDDSDDKQTSDSSPDTELGQLETANNALSSIQTSASGIYGLLMSWEASKEGYNLTTKEGAAKFLDEVLLASGMVVEAPPNRSDSQSDSDYAQAMEEWYNSLDPQVKTIIDVATGRVTPGQALQEENTAEAINSGLLLAEQIDKESAFQKKYLNYMIAEKSKTPEENNSQEGKEEEVIAKSEDTEDDPTASLRTEYRNAEEELRALYAKQGLTEEEINKNINTLMGSINEEIEESLKSNENKTSEKSSDTPSEQTTKPEEESLEVAATSIEKETVLTTEDAVPGQDVDSLTQQINGLSDENSTLKETSNTLREEKATLESAKVALENTNATLVEGNDKLSKDQQLLLSKNVELGTSLEDLTKANEAQQTEINSQKTEIDTLKKSLTGLENEVDNLESQLSEQTEENQLIQAAYSLLFTPPDNPVMAAGGYQYSDLGINGSEFFIPENENDSIYKLLFEAASFPSITGWEELYEKLVFGNKERSKVESVDQRGNNQNTGYYSTTIGGEEIKIWEEGIGFTDTFKGTSLWQNLPKGFIDNLDFDKIDIKNSFSSMMAAWGAWESYAELFDGATNMLSLEADDYGNFTIKLDFSEEAYKEFGGKEQATKDREKWQQYNDVTKLPYYNANYQLVEAAYDYPDLRSFFIGLQNLLPSINEVEPPENLKEEWSILVNNLYSQIENGQWSTVKDTLAQMSAIISNNSSVVSSALGLLSGAAENAASRLNAITIANGETNNESSASGNSQYTGNVSGLAFAEGNTGLDRLNLGARLAGQTLVGELGPELAVYDGMYHLLGQNGAEFVNLPSDAIVFNHRQTAGIIRGQAGYRGTALAEGNADDIIKGDAFVNGHISGPAFADASGALAQLKSLRAMWQSILGMTAQDLANTGGGGGGGGNSLKAVTAELTEWYNLTRQIENLEQEINNLIAERENIAKDNGEAYLRNLRETQKLLQQQKLTQQILLDYQEKQLARQRDHINNHSIWSQFLTIGEDGLLQYIKGNEANGGKGALSVLQQLNAMSGKQQVDFVKKLGYSYTDEDGKKLKDSELVSKFFEELQDQIDQYDELYDTVNGTKETIEGLTSDIQAINDEILENQKELEQDVYDILVEAWEKEIEALEEQTELIEEANKAYVDGLKDALKTEKDLYEKNESTEERESLQRQLSLLRRSGGSASEIADLEEQLNDTLKDEYFKNQERMIENIEDANKEQVRKLEEQITLQKEALEYQKENGVLWTEVYKVLAGTKEEILKFMQGKHTEFFSKSALQQEEMLTDWAHKIGIYTEERQYENHTKAATTIWDSNDLWNGEILNGLRGRYEGLKDDQKETLEKIFTDTYANSMINGASEEDSRKSAEEEVKKYLNQAYDENGNLIEESKPEPSKSSGGNSNAAYVTVTYKVEPAEAKTAGCSISGPSKIQVGKEGTVTVKTAKGWAKFGWSSSDNTVASIGSGVIVAKKKGSVVITQKYLKRDSDYESNANSLSDTAVTDEKTGVLTETYANTGGFKITNEGTTLFDSKEKYKNKNEATAAAKSKLAEYDKKKYPKAKYTLYGFSQGGLVDYTGLAMVHGSQSKPEAFLNASQTAQIKEALEATHGKENLLKGLHSTVDKLHSLIHNINTINNSKNYDINIAPGAVVINVDELANSYDVEELSADIMNRMAAIASKATNRGVNRR